MKNIYLISDTHFNHKTMIDEQWRNFKSIEEMNEFIIERWNSVVSDEDTVYHLGDVVLNNKTDFDKNIRPRLKGNIIFIRGNHDNLGISHIKSMIIQHKGYEFELIHNPNECSGKYKFVINGHIHKNGKRTLILKKGIKYFNVNVEFNKYKPVLINQILGEIRGKFTND